MDTNSCKESPEINEYSDRWDRIIPLLRQYRGKIGEFSQPYHWIIREDYMNKYVMNGTVTIECDCGCVKLEVVKETEEGLTLYYLSAYESSFGARQNKVKQYLTRLWNAIVGKDYHLYELVLTRDEYKKLDF